MRTGGGRGGEVSEILKISGDEVDGKNLKGDLLHLTFSLSEGNIFGGRGRVEAGRVTFEGTYDRNGKKPFKQ